jgi:hypothetical protein
LFIYFFIFTKNLFSFYIHFFNCFFFHNTCLTSNNTNFFTMFVASTIIFYELAFHWLSAPFPSFYFHIYIIYFNNGFHLRCFRICLRFLALSLVIYPFPPFYFHNYIIYFNNGFHLRCFRICWRFLALSLVICPIPAILFS